MIRVRLLVIPSSPRRLVAIVLSTTMVIVLLALAGPPGARGIFVGLFFAANLVGGVLLLTVPRRLQALRLQSVIGRGAKAAPSRPPGLLRRLFWRKLTWILDTTVSLADTTSFLRDLVTYMKEVCEWPFGDPTTALHLSEEGFATAPGWFWRNAAQVNRHGLVGSMGIRLNGLN